METRTQLKSVIFTTDIFAVYWKFTDENGTGSLTKIGEAAKNLDCISVWDKFDGPEFEERLFVPTKENSYMGCL